MDRAHYPQILPAAVRGKKWGELINLKSYTQMADSEDFRFPYRFKKLYLVEVGSPYRFEKLYSAEFRLPYRFENYTKIEKYEKRNVSMTGFEMLR